MTLNSHVGIINGTKALNSFLICEDRQNIDDYVAFFILPKIVFKAQLVAY